MRGCRCDVSLDSLNAIAFQMLRKPIPFTSYTDTADLPDDLSIDANIRNMACDDCWHAFFCFSAFQAAWQVGLEKSSLIGFRGCMYRKSFDSMRESSANGCRWCFVVSETIKDKVRVLPSLWGML